MSSAALLTWTCGGWEGRREWQVPTVFGGTTVGCTLGLRPLPQSSAVCAAYGQQPGGWTSKVKAPADAVSGEVPCWFIDHLLSVSSLGGRAGGSLGSFIRALNLCMGVHPHDLITPDTITLGVRFQHVTFGETHTLPLNLKTQALQKQLMLKQRSQGSSAKMTAAAA